MSKNKKISENNYAEDNAVDSEGCEAVALHEIHKEFNCREGYNE